MGVIFFYKLRQRLQLLQLGDFMFAVKWAQAIFKRHFFNLFHGPKLLKEFYEELSQYTKCHRVQMKLLSAFCAHQISSDTLSPHTHLSTGFPPHHIFQQVTPLWSRFLTQPAPGLEIRCRELLSNIYLFTYLQQIFHDTFADIYLQN